MHPYQTPCQGAYSIRTATHTTYVRTLQVHNRMTISNIQIQHGHLISMTPLAYPWSFCYISILWVFISQETVLLYTIYKHNCTKLLGTWRRSSWSNASLQYKLNRYCHFGETLLTLSRVVDMSMIYLRRYAVGAFMTIMCTNKSGRFQ